MLNTEEFIKRLEKLMEFYGLSASLFADKIGVQRSGISHLLSGRNKPSLDFVLKICEEFPEVDLYWLLNGNGTLLKPDTAPITSIVSETKKIISEENHFPTEIKSGKENTKIETDSSMFKIVLLYNDGSFKDFEPKR